MQRPRSSYDGRGAVPTTHVMTTSVPPPLQLCHEPGRRLAMAMVHVLASTGAAGMAVAMTMLTIVG
jgi:hypothetical protein